MNPKTRFLGVVLIATLSALITPAQTAPITPPQDLDAFAGRVLKEFEVPGLAVAIVKDGKVVLAKGYGVRKLGDPATVDENTYSESLRTPKRSPRRPWRCSSMKARLPGTIRSQSTCPRFNFTTPTLPAK